MLLSMLPVALPPPGLRDQLFYLIDDMGPTASAYRAGVIHRAGPFGWSGFPEPLDPPHADHRQKTRALAVGVAVLAVFAGGAMFGSAVLHPHPGDSATAAGATPYSAAPAPSVLPEVTVRSKPHAPSSPPAFASPNVPWITATPPTGIIAHSQPKSGSTAPPPASPSPTPAPSNPATATPSASPTPAPSNSASPTASASPTGSASPSAQASTLVPSPALVALTLTVAASAP